MKAFFLHLELALTAAGLLVIWTVPQLVAGPGSHPWQVTAWTAIGVGVTHGVLFWVVRRRQRHTRERVLAQSRCMLHEIGQNHVAALLTLSAGASPSERERLGGVMDALAFLDGLLDSLTDDGLREWAARRPALIGLMMNPDAPQPGAGRISGAQWYPN